MKRVGYILIIGAFFIAVVVQAVPINIDGKNIHVTGGHIIGDNGVVISGVDNIAGPGTGYLSGYTITISDNSLSSSMFKRKSGGPPDNTMFFRWDNTWAVPVTSVSDNTITPANMNVNEGFANSLNFYRGDGKWKPIGNANLVDNDVLPSKLKSYSVPDNNASVGVRGAYAMDNTHFYWCYADNNWRRAAYDNTW